MMRSMYAGVSGLRNHQVRMDVIGNNIANVNTVGYKKGRVTFQDMLSQNIRGASSPQGGRGGSNPQQIGLGMSINSIDTIWTPGSSETTGKVTDMMVEGDGLFVVSDGDNRYYTRAGNFDFDSLGNFLTPAGLKVQGWMADKSGVIDNSTGIGSIQIPKGAAIQPKATLTAQVVGNLDANGVIPSGTDPGTTVKVPIDIYDSLGRNWTMNLQFDKSASNTWDVSLDPASIPSWTDAPTITGGPLVFNPDGTLDTASSTLPIQIEGTPPDADGFAVADSTAITVDLATLTQYASQLQDGSGSEVKLNSQDGYASGVLNGFSIDASGVITGRFSNGFSQQLAQVALTNFNNPAGLTKSGENLYSESNNSGRPQTGTAGTGGRGAISPGRLEMSNVDLSQEFTDMIVTQRGFQANSRIITVSDEMLQELVNLKR